MNCPNTYCHDGWVTTGATAVLRPFCIPCQHEQCPAKASPAYEGKGKDDPGSSGGCVTGRDVGDDRG